MTQEEWNEMSNQQRHEYLSAGEIKIEKQIVFRADSKVNDDDEKAVLCFTAHCRGIQISNRHDTNTAAMEEAVANINALAT